MRCLRCWSIQRGMNKWTPSPHRSPSSNSSLQLTSPSKFHLMQSHGSDKGTRQRLDAYRRDLAHDPVLPQSTQNLLCNQDRRLAEEYLPYIEERSRKCRLCIRVLRDFQFIRLLCARQHPPAANFGQHCRNSCPCLRPDTANLHGCFRGVRCVNTYRNDAKIATIPKRLSRRLSLEIGRLQDAQAGPEIESSPSP